MQVFNSVVINSIKIMKKLVVVFFAILSLSCSDDSLPIPAASLTITPVLIDKGLIFNANYNGTQHGEVIVNQSDWDNFRNNYWVDGITVAEANNINFNTQMILLVFDSPRTTGGYDAVINSISENNLNIMVQVAYSGNGDATQLPTRPYHFVKIPKSTKPVVFQ